MEALTVNRYIQAICPVCKARRVIQLPKSIVDQASNLTTISVPQNLVCKHHFQLFIDKNFEIRGYQKVDYQLNSEAIEKEKTLKPTYEDHFVNSLDLCQSSESEKKTSKDIPEKLDCRVKTSTFEDNFIKNHKMTLNEIYDEFWEFIDDKNEVFQRFIAGDEKRRTLLKMKDLTPRIENKTI